jgi:tRNA-modifying protein YgfZ
MTVTPAYEAASSGAILVDRSSEARVSVRGADRVTWLQGLLTNDVARLQPGQGCYAAYLTPQGRMISDVRVLAQPDALLLDLPASGRSAVLERFDQFIISEEVEIEDVTAVVGRLGVHGPRSLEVLLGAVGEIGMPEATVLNQLAEHEHLTVELGGEPVIVAGSRDIGRLGFDIYCQAAALPRVAEALAAAGAIDIDAETWDTLRIEAGRPVFGVDMDTDTIPLEAGIEDRAIDHNKGCYVGQEVIVRILHRGGGRVVRKLVGLVADAPTASADQVWHGHAIAADGREIGRVTSATFSPVLGRTIMLGYVHRDFVAKGTPVTVDAATPIPAHVSALPFVQHLAQEFP